MAVAVRGPTEPNPLRVSTDVSVDYKETSRAETQLIEPEIMESGGFRVMDRSVILPGLRVTSPRSPDFLENCALDRRLSESHHPKDPTILQVNQSDTLGGGLMSFARNSPVSFQKATPAQSLESSSLFLRPDIKKLTFPEHAMLDIPEKSSIDCQSLKNSSTPQNSGEPEPEFQIEVNET